MAAPIAPEVQQLVSSCIGTVPHLEGLLLLYHAPGRSWSASEVAARIYVDERTAEDVLADLAAHALVRTVPGTVPAWQFDSAGTQVAVVEQLAECHRTHLIAITQLIHSRVSNPVRDSLVHSVSGGIASAGVAGISARNAGHTAVRQSAVARLCARSSEIAVVERPVFLRTYRVQRTVVSGSERIPRGQPVSVATGDCRLSMVVLVYGLVFESE